ncbi:hypothetical protein VNO77_44831 [Canavalia gladiata]|uniref:Uncharacterized protein n=1 Tax=Canavalia gladiata TaxID=3824 RepID=A0AAN9JZ49_CANGL
METRTKTRTNQLNRRINIFKLLLLSLSSSHLNQNVHLDLRALACKIALAFSLRLTLSHHGCSKPFIFTLTLFYIKDECTWAQGDPILGANLSEAKRVKNPKEQGGSYENFLTSGGGSLDLLPQTDSSENQKKNLLMLAWGKTVNSALCLHDMGSTCIHLYLELNIHHYHMILEPKTNSVLHSIKRSMFIWELHVSQLLLCPWWEPRLKGFSCQRIWSCVLCLETFSPELTLVEKIMTLNPNYASTETTILDTQHVVHDRKFLHFPMIDKDRYVTVCRDVWLITQAAISLVEDSSVSVNDVDCRHETESLFFIQGTTWKLKLVCPFWFSAGAKALVHKILDPYPKTRMKIEEIRKDPSLQRNYFLSSLGKMSK